MTMTINFNDIPADIRLGDMLAHDLPMYVEIGNEKYNFRFSGLQLDGLDYSNDVGKDKKVTLELTNKTERK